MNGPRATCAGNGARYSLQALPKGGFVVFDESYGRHEMSGGALFASTEIDDALGFIKDEMQPPADRPNPPQADAVNVAAIDGHRVKVA